MASNDLEIPVSVGDESTEKPVAHSGPLTRDLFATYIKQFASPLHATLVQDTGHAEVATDIAQQALALLAVRASRSAISDVGRVLKSTVPRLLEREIPERDDAELVAMVGHAHNLPVKQQSASELFHRYNDNLVRAVCMMTPNIEDARDAAQQAWATFLLKADQFDPARCKSFTGWLVTITKHAFLDMQRRQNNRLDTLRSKQKKVRRTASHPWMTSLVIQEAMGRLSVESQRVLEQYYFEQKTLREIAEQEGVSLPGIQRRLQRAREAVRQILLADM